MAEVDEIPTPQPQDKKSDDPASVEAPPAEAAPAASAVAGADAAPSPEASSSAEAKSEKASGSDGPPKSNAPELPVEEMSFAEMFELAEKQSADKKKKFRETVGSNISPGKIVYARVVGISHDSVFLDVGAKAEGVIAKSELLDEEGNLTIKEGDRVEARVRNFDGGSINLTRTLPHQSLRNKELIQESFRTEIPIKGKVTAQNKGGFDVDISGLRAFCPASQMDLRPTKGSSHIGQQYEFRITELKDGGRNIVVSRRVLLLAEQRKKAEETLKTLTVGSEVTGKVTSLKDYGAFVDLGGVEGLVHLSEISHGHLSKASDLLKEGQEIRVKVLKLQNGKDETKKISLSIKALEVNPWDAARDSLREGQKVKGKVLRIQSFGAFVEISPGVDGMIHVSNMALGKRVKDPREIVKEGEEVEATIVTVDWERQRIGLSLVKTRQELANELSEGDVIEGTIDRIESFGLFVKLPSGARGLVPAAETGTERGSDLKKVFKPGETVKVTVRDRDSKSGKIRLSIRAVKEAEERREFAGYMNNASTKGSGLGTLGDLFKAQLGHKLDKQK